MESLNPHSSSEQSNKTQEKILHTLRFQTFLQLLILAALAALVILFVIAGQRLAEFLPKLDELMTSIKNAMDSVKVLSQSLDKVDLAGMSERFSSIDFDGLNQAIQNLESITKPLANLFGR